MLGLIVVLITVSIAVVLFTLFTLFRSVAYQNQYVLSSYVDNQALLFERMLYDQPDWQIESRRVVLERVYQQFERQTLPINQSTGEFQVVFADGEMVFWLLPNGETVSHPRYLLDDRVVNAALNGGHGLVVLDSDTEDARVKAFSSIAEWEVAFVLTLQMDEIRQPFISAAISAVIAAIFLTSIGGWVFYRLSRPIIVDLEENEAKYRTLFDNANEGVLLLSPEVIECNDRAAMILDIPKWQLIGLDLTEFNSAEEHIVDPGKVIELAWQGAPQYFLWSAKSASGRLLELEVMMRKIQLDERDALLVTLVDITDRKRYEKDLRQAEKAIRDSRDHLAHVARLNTMGEMAAGIAHEINQPLSAITTYAQASRTLLSSENLDREMFEEALEQIAKQARRAGEVIRRLREFVNKSGTNTELVDPESLVSESVALGMVDARNLDLPLNIYSAKTDVKVRADAVQIQQVLINLIRNALEAVASSRQEGGKVDISLEVEEPWVTIKVSDNGPGLSEDALKRIFHPFYTTKASGMGIGLSISYSIVQSHKGQLTAYNQEDGGAVFELKLPIAKNRDMKE